MELNQSSVPASVWWNSQSSVTSWWVRLWSTLALPGVLLCLIFSFVSGVTEVKIWCYFFKFFIYFFLFWLCWVLVAVQAFLWLWRAGATTHRGLWASHCSGLPREAWALGWEAFSSCSSWALENQLSTCGTRALLFFGLWDLPRLGIKPPCLLPWQAGSLPPSHYGSPSYCFLTDTFCDVQPSECVLIHKMGTWQSYLSGFKKSSKTHHHCS